jgi:hypothetical protein
MYGFCLVLNNAVRVGVAAGKASERMRSATESAPETPTRSAPKSTD